MSREEEPPRSEEVFRNTLSGLLDNTAKALTDLFAAEDNTRQVYSDRFVFELLQNARDAAARGTPSSPRVRIEIGYPGDGPSRSERPRPRRPRCFTEADERLVRSPRQPGCGSVFCTTTSSRPMAATARSSPLICRAISTDQSMDSDIRSPAAPRGALHHSPHRARSRRTPTPPTSRPVPPSGRPRLAPLRMERLRKSGRPLVPLFSRRAATRHPGLVLSSGADDGGLDDRLGRLRRRPSRCCASWLLPLSDSRGGGEHPPKM